MVFDDVGIYIYGSTRFINFFRTFPGLTIILTKYTEFISNKPTSTIYHCKNIIKPNDNC